MLWMYVGAATESTTGAIASSTTNDVKTTVAEDIHKNSTHDDSTAMTTKTNNDHMYACSLNKMKLKGSEVSNLHDDDDIKEIITNIICQQRNSDKYIEDEDELARQIALHILDHDSSVEHELTKTVSDHPDMLDLSLPKIAVEQENVTQCVPLNLTINAKSGAVKSGLLFVETFNSSKSTDDR